MNENLSNSRKSVFDRRIIYCIIFVGCIEANNPIPSEKVCGFYQELLLTSLLSGAHYMDLHAIKTLFEIRDYTTVQKSGKTTL